MFDAVRENSHYTIPLLDAVPGKNVWWAELVGTKEENRSSNSLAGSFMRIISGEPSVTPQYPFDETGGVVKGTLAVKDETGKTEILHEGEAFFIHRGGVITLSTDRIAVIFKTSGTAPMTL